MLPERQRRRGHQHGEVFSTAGADQAATWVTCGEARLKDLHLTIATLLVAHACNVDDACAPGLLLLAGTRGEGRAWRPVGCGSPRSVGDAQQ